MSDDNNNSQPQSPPTYNRRSSFAGQALADIFGTGRSSVSRPPNESNNSPPSQYTGPITSAAAQAQRRRMSLTTLGLSGSTGQTSPFGSYRGRTDSFGSTNGASTDESAIAEDDGPAVSRDPNNSPNQTSFARRTSFGARALRDIRTNSISGGNSGGAPSSPGQNGTRSPPALSRTKGNTPSNGTISSRDAKGRGSNEGFNWSDNLRTRAERTSIAGQSGPVGGPIVGPVGGGGGHARAKSVATMEPPPASQMPKPKEPTRPDHFQERILKGDFYMD